MLEVSGPEKCRNVRVKDWSQQVEHMQVPNGTGPCMCPEECAQWARKLSDCVSEVSEWVCEIDKIDDWVNWVRKWRKWLSK